MSELPELYKLGANQVIPEFKTSIKIFSRVLAQFGICAISSSAKSKTFAAKVQMLRSASLPLADLRELIAEAFDGVTSDIFSFQPADSPAVGHAPWGIGFAAACLGCHHFQRGPRRKPRSSTPGAEFEIAAEDILVFDGCAGTDRTRACGIQKAETKQGTFQPVTAESNRLALAQFRRAMQFHNPGSDLEFARERQSLCPG